jgi:hypothetical protein
MLDFRTFLADPDAFVDLAHLNAQGRAAFSAAAGKALHGLLR